MKMKYVYSFCFVLIALTIYSVTVNAVYEEPPSPFSISLDLLQQNINYEFKSIGLLRRAMTHASYSAENNKALSILGAKMIETSVSLRSLIKNIDISSKELSRLIADICTVDPCASDGMQLQLQKVVRVSAKTSSSTPPVVCGAYRAMFGAIAVDANSTDVAESVFWKVHGGHNGRAFE